MHKIRITPEGQYQMTIGDLWEDCSSEEFFELFRAGYELIDYEESLLLEN